MLPAQPITLLPPTPRGSPVFGLPKPSFFLYFLSWALSWPSLAALRLHLAAKMSQDVAEMPRDSST